MFTITDNPKAASVSQESRPQERLWNRLLPYLVISVLTMVFNFPFLLPGMGNMYGGDFAMFYLPFRIYSSMQLHAGDLPFRTNDIFGGYPIWQDPQFSLLYPVNLLFGLLFPNFAAEAVIDLYMLVNLIILSLSAVYFIRSAGISRFGAVAGACVISFTAFTVTHSQYLAMLQIESMSLFASGFLIRYFRGGATNFRFPMAAGIVLAIGNLAGNPQPIVYYHYAIAIGVAVLAAQLWWTTGDLKAGVRMAAGGIAAFVIGILLAAVHLVPTAYLISISQRAEITREAAVWSPLGLQQLSMLLFPGFYQILPWQLQWPPYTVNFDLSFTNLVEGYIPIGVFAATLGLLGWFHYRKSILVQVLGWGSLLVLGCAVGDALPFYGWLYSYFPGISLLRVSARILLVFFPAWGMLVALGAQALWRNEPNAIRSSRIVVLLLLVIIGRTFAYAFAGHSPWISAWLNNMAEFVQDYVRQNISFLMSHKSAIMSGLVTQIVLGTFFVVTMTLLFTLPRRRYRVRSLAILSFMCVEIFLYSFGWNMAINTPPLDSGIVDEYYSFPGKVDGRIIALHGVYNGPINAAIYMDSPPLANGYSVTFDKWVGAFWPAGHAPWSIGIQEVLCDLWNVSDLAFPRRPVAAQVAGQAMTVGDWGWTALARPPEPASGISIDIGRSEMTTSLTLAFSTEQPIKALHLLALSNESGPFPDGTEIGVVTVKTTDSDEKVSASVLLGKHVSDPLYPEPERSDLIRPAHSLAPVAFRRIGTNDWTDGSLIYDANLNLATSSPLVSLEFEVTTSYPLTFAVSHAVAILEDGTPVIREAFETAGFKETESQNLFYYTVRREESGGYIRMFSNAIGGSYKHTEYIFSRLFNDKIDPLKTLVVDKRLLDEEALEKLNAPDPDNFRGTATITWKNDENAVVRAEANQPGWVSLSYAWDAGWSATTNGEATAIYRASGPFMAFPVKAGETEIVMSYRPQGLLLGGGISSISLVGLIGVWIYAGKRKKPVRVI